MPNIITTETDFKQKIDGFYKSGFWTKEMVAAAVERDIITASDYEEITGEAHHAK